MGKRAAKERGDVEGPKERESTLGEVEELEERACVRIVTMQMSHKLTQKHVHVRGDQISLKGQRRGSLQYRSDDVDDVRTTSMAYMLEDRVTMTHIITEQYKVSSARTQKSTTLNLEANSFFAHMTYVTLAVIRHFP